MGTVGNVASSEGFVGRVGVEEATSGEASSKCYDLGV